ncbi:MAG: type II toxin-antitoxin system VapC family toxin [Bosea sp. (in: a-proteobacteria)]
MTSFSSIYVDTNAFIYAFEGEKTDDNLAVRNTLETLGPLSLETSELTLAEMLVKAFQENDQARVRRYKALFQLEGNGYFKVRTVSMNILVGAAWHRGIQQVMPGKERKLYDSIHVATASFWGCSHFMTSDRRIRLPDNMARVNPTRADIDGFLVSR